uniref:Uncharacterized protein n=1 Tax=Trichuris muris TaxID=70415 RepID=A0A5S6QBR3_TRIMR
MFSWHSSLPSVGGRNVLYAGVKVIPRQRPLEGVSVSQVDHSAGRPAPPPPSDEANIFLQAEKLRGKRQFAVGRVGETGRGRGQGAANRWKGTLGNRRISSAAPIGLRASGGRRKRRPLVALGPRRRGARRRSNQNDAQPIDFCAAHGLAALAWISAARTCPNRSLLAGVA